MGLNDSYSVMRGSILMKSPLPTVSLVYNILFQEESQREIHSGAHFIIDSVSLVANSGLQPANQTTGSLVKKYGGSESKKSNLHCNYYKKQEHTTDKCYKIHDSLMISNLLRIRDFPIMFLMFLQLRL